MTAVLVTRTTSTVEHLGAFAYDRESPEAWDTGRHVPICGSERNHGHWSLVDWPGRTMPSPARHRRPLCKRCRKLLHQLTALAEGLHQLHQTDDPTLTEAP